MFLKLEHLGRKFFGIKFHVTSGMAPANALCTAASVAGADASLIDGTIVEVQFDFHSILVMVLDLIMKTVRYDIERQEHMRFVTVQSINPICS